MYLLFPQVNNDIAVLSYTRMKAPDRVELLKHILQEHNELCRCVAQFNKFWAKYLMNSYFLMITIVCFCSFQAFFTHNFIYVRILMFYFACLAAFLITKISMCAATMSTKVRTYLPLNDLDILTINSSQAHAPYKKLIRVTFEKYPVEVQIHLRMLIQRTSGPTIGFYCLDVFEITFTTYASVSLSSLYYLFLISLITGRELLFIAFINIDPSSTRSKFPSHR